jgi:hypothetical protein
MPPRPRRLGSPRARVSLRVLSAICLAIGLAWWSKSALATPAPEVVEPEVVEIVAKLAASAEVLAREAGDTANAPVLGALMFYDPARDLAGGVDGAAYGAGDRAWVEAALGVYDLYRQIGGEAGDKRYLFRRDGARVFVGLDGGAGAWHPTMARGQAAFLRLLTRSSRALPQGLRRAVARDAGVGLARAIDAVTAVLAEPGKTLLLPAGATRSLVIEDAWHAVGTPGLEVHAAPTPAGDLATTIGKRSGEAASPQAVLVFAPGQRFSAREMIEVATPDGRGGPSRGIATPTAQAPAQNAGPARLDPASPVAVPDVIAASGAARRYTLSVPSVGAYSIRSTGPSDLVGVLKGPDGVVLARDDDGGEGYNFNLQATLQAGDYTVEVVHCCAGTGPFSIVVAPK